MMSTATVSSKEHKDIREEKMKDNKLEEQILKSLNAGSSTEEKLNALMKKCVEVEKENKKLQSTLKQHEKRHEKRYVVLFREKDNLQKEHNKGILMRDKLEQVCREQQKLIKSVKNESMTKIREEEEKRKENQTKFQQSINEINILLNKNNEENIKLKEDNIEMTKRLKFLQEQCQVREQYLEKINEQVKLESQLHGAKLAKVQMEAAIEKKILNKEKESAFEDLMNCKKAIQEMQAREELLKQQLNLYTSKYDDFQSSLQQRNDIFTTYKMEIEKMTKRMKKLEKEALEWKQKCERSNVTILDMATEKQSKDEYISKCTRQIHQLEKLLRTLQAERVALHQTLKENNIERPSAPVLPTTPEPIGPPPPSKPQADKMELMAKNCAQLKETLAKLQGQMNEIVNKQENPPPVVESETKKVKSKKPKNKNKCSVIAKLDNNQNKESTKLVESNSKNGDIANNVEEICNYQNNEEFIVAEVSDSLNNLFVQSKINSEDNVLTTIEKCTDINQPTHIPTNTDVTNCINQPEESNNIEPDDVTNVKDNLEEIELCLNNENTLFPQDEIITSDQMHKESVIQTIDI